MKEVRAVEATNRELNDLLTGTFDLVIKMEQATFRGTRYGDLTVAEIHTIEAIGEQESTMGEIAARLGVTLATLNTTVGRLCAKGYAERRRTEEDRRLVLVSLTRPGKVVNRLHDRFHVKMIANATEGFSAQEREVLVRALSKIREFIEDFDNVEMTGGTEQ